MAIFVSRTVLGLLAATTFSLIEVYAQGPPTDGSLFSFKSRPDLYPPKLNVSINEPTTSAGYIFMAPYQIFQPSAVIYATDGTLIWSGFGMTGNANNGEFRVCSYNNSDHLCFYQGAQYLGYGRGQGMIMDNTFATVASIRGQNGVVGIDGHEMHVINGSAYVTVYQPTPYDLSGYGISGGLGWLSNNLFQQIDLETGELLFEWSAIEHVGLEETYVEPGKGDVSGTGFDPLSTWDYFHMNSVDRNEDGDFLVSSRHTSTLYKVSGQDGHIIWRCGGKFSDFEFEPGLNWSYQHNAIWRSSDANTDVITVFNNGVNTTALHSSGMIVVLNHTATPPTVSLHQRFTSPPANPISNSQGNVQLLGDNWETASAFIGWGSEPYITEHDTQGNIIYQANLLGSSTFNYRAYKFNFTSNPRESPALYSYARDTNSNTTFYMSWNGATELQQWRLYGRSSCNETWSELATVYKAGFETTYEVAGYQEFTMVEALDGSGTGLRNSSTRGVRTFVPGPLLVNACNGTSCAPATAYSNASVSINAALETETLSACAFSSVSRTSAAASATSSSSNDTDTKANAATREGTNTKLLGFLFVLALVLL